MRDLLFISHCVPNPPNKGERIRAHAEFKHLTKRYRLHLACCARDEEEWNAVKELSSLCETAHVERLRRSDLALAGVRFAFGSSLSTAYFDGSGLRRHIARVVDQYKPSGAFVFCSSVAHLVPRGMKYVADLVDVDSEKWKGFSTSKSPGFVYAMEARRLAREERRIGATATKVLLTTAAERDLFLRVAPGSDAGYFENGIDLSYWNPAGVAAGAMTGRRYAVFVGTMNYHPNDEAARWFAAEALPRIREIRGDFEFVAVGRNPSDRLLQMNGKGGVTVTGAVDDVRPYLAEARAFVAPLRIARGVQNKVLEALAMNRPVLASADICRTFGADVPGGITCCDSIGDYVRGLTEEEGPAPVADLRSGIEARFDWDTNLRILDEALDSIGL
jgi:sugar transferase (PEP-CTERM/EpsH1 system associated)